MERLSPDATVSGKEPVRGAASKARPDGGEDILLGNEQSDSFSSSSFSNNNGSKPGKHCWEEGCNRQAEAGPMSREGEIDLFCSDHQGSDVITTRIKYCRFTGCLNTPKYGQRMGPLKFCQRHKRVGMYTSRKGQLLVATRDGSAFRDEDDSEEVAEAWSRNNFAVRKEIHDNVADDSTTGLWEPGGELSAPNQSKFQQPSGEAGLQGSAETFGLGPRGAQGTSRPRFCTSHKKEGMMGLKKRLCIFPGCSTRPHYGLSGCRPIFCAKHKEANMVHLLKEATNREKIGVTRDPGETTRISPEHIRRPSKRLLSVSSSKGEKLRRNTPKKNAEFFQNEDHEELDSRKGEDAVSPPALPLVRKQQKRKKEDARKESSYCRGKTASSTLATSSSSTSTSTPLSSNEFLAQVRSAVEPGDPGKGGNASGASPFLPKEKPSSRLAGTSGMSSSSGIHVRKDVREPAKVETTARSSGKRSRVPSRKALEASGKLVNEGIQRLTKEKKAEETKRIKEIKARRKAAAEVGLRAGHMIETETIDPVVGRESTGADSSDADNVAKAEPAKIRWRKLSPVEIMELSAKKSTTYVNDKTHPGGGRHVVSLEREANNRWWGDSVNAVIARTSEGKRKEIVWHPQSSARAIMLKSGAACPQDAKRRKESFDDLSAQMRQVITSADGKTPWEVPTWESMGNDTGNIGVGEIGGMKVCQFEGCARKATFGVNGIVRYCKLHAIFGMRRINIPV